MMFSKYFFSIPRAESHNFNKRVPTFGWEPYLSRLGSQNEAFPLGTREEEMIECWRTDKLMIKRLFLRILVTGTLLSV